MHKIMINCGHGKSSDGTWDAGCVYGKHTEAGLMLPITKAAVKYLRSSGIKVLSDSDTGNNKNMVADVAWANREKVELYVSIHCDYYKAPSGVMPLYVSASGKKLATALNTAIKSSLGMKSRGVSKRTDLWELNGTDMTACILETGSIKADLSILKNKPDTYGKAIAKGICAYLGVTFKASAAKKKVTYPERKKYISKLDSIGEVVEKKFSYSNDGSKTSWTAAKSASRKVTNCARYNSWALQEAGILSKGKTIWWKNGKLCGPGAAQFKASKKLKRYKPNKTVKAMAKAGTLKPGDICFFSQGNHTMTVKTVNKKTGKVWWYSAGPGEVKAHKVRGARKSGYDSRKVSYMGRIIK